jgi:NADH-quinone oxidoreductase subunit M
LWLYRRVIFGPLVKDELKSILDLSPREVAVFAPLVILVLWMGLYPSSFTQVYDASIASLLEDYRQALQNEPGMSLAGAFAR